jgi:DNA-binding CsgD family transcriptional regulator
MLALVGPAGIGKSELLGELVRNAREHGIRVLHARGTELERDFAFGVTRQLFEPALADLPEEERAALFDGAASHAAPLLDPASATETVTSLDPGFASLHGLYWLTANLAAEEPILIAVDDAHWADRASLRWLVHLAARLEGVPALLAVAIREPEPGVDEPLIEQLRNQPGGLQIRPATLSSKAVARLTSEGLGAQPDASFVRACERSTGGNPFLLRELLADLDHDGTAPTAANARGVESLGPRNVARSVLGRIGRLPGECLALATALAILGDGTVLATVAQLAGLTLVDAEGAADQLVMAGILARSERLGFAHPIVAAAVRSDLPPRRKESMHREAARLLAETDATPARIAVHLLPTEPRGDPWVFEQLLGAAGEAFSAGALEQARDYLDRVLAEGGARDPAQRALALSLLGWIEAVRNEEPRAIEHLRQALELTEDPLQRALLARGLSSVLIAVNRYVESFEVLDRAIAELPQEQAELGVRLEGELCVGRWLSCEVRRRLDARTNRFPVDPGEVASGLLIAADALEEMLAGSAEEGSRLARQALFDGRLIAEETADSPALYAVVAALQGVDDLRFGLDIVERIVAEAGERASIRGRAAALSWRAGYNLRLGRVDDGLADALAALELDVSGPFVPVTVAHLINARVDQGELELAEEALDAHDPNRHTTGEELLFQYYRLSEANLRAVQGNGEAGLAVMDEYADYQQAWALPNDGWPWRSMRAQLLALVGRRDEARALALEEIERFAAEGTPRMLGVAYRIAGELGEGHERVEMLDRAAELLARSPYRLEYARALVELGAAIRVSGSPAAAREPLNQGLELARRCGGLGVAERAYEELLAAGVKPRKILRTGVDALTPSESRIARKAAEGRTNKEIAQELFVTVRTVETHLHNAFQKLDVSSRTELPRALATD